MKTKTLKKKIAAIVGRENCLDNVEELMAHSYDGSAYQARPGLVVRPGQAVEIAEICRLCHRAGFPVVPRGAATGYTGGSVPPPGGVVIDLGRLNRIIDIRPEERIGIVEPLVINRDFQERLQPLGLFYPPDPASLKASSLGGNVAENAGGPHCVKYGVTRDYVAGLEFVTMTGAIIRTGYLAENWRQTPELMPLLISSEGTLGIITQLALRVIPRPARTALILARFSAMEQAAATISAVVAAGILPAVMEFMDQSTVEAVSNFTGKRSLADVAAVILFEVDGFSQRDVAAQQSRIEQLCQQHGSLQIQISRTTAEEVELWTMRRNISPALRSLAPKKINEDIAVPRSKIPEMVNYIVDLANEYDIRIVTFGHAGDGNIHVNVMTDESKTEEFQRAMTAVDAIFAKTIALNGVLSGEHGIGLAKKNWLDWQLSAEVIALHRRVKAAFDPGYRLNPGKIFSPAPEDYSDLPAA